MRKSFGLVLFLLLSLLLTSCSSTKSNLLNSIINSSDSITATASSPASENETFQIEQEKPEPEDKRETDTDIDNETAAEAEPALRTTAPEDAASYSDIITGIEEDLSYTTKENVALYIHTYGKLPLNFITKKQAEELGWNGGGLEEYAPGKCIGGDYFGNYEGLLPVKDGRVYAECDIETLGASSRGAKRIVYSNDGLIYYTDDHYESFTLLYGEETK